jgi:hypothetical protein
MLKLPSTSLLQRPDRPAPSNGIAGPSAVADNPRAAGQRRGANFPIPANLLFQSVFNGVSGVYRWRFDEALRRGLVDATAMRRDWLIHPELEKRKTATVSLPWHIEADDPKAPVQKAMTSKYTKILEATPRFHDLRYALEERIWYGKAGSMMEWDTAWVNGQKVTAIVAHSPVNGDSIGFHRDGTPKISVNATWRPERGNRLIPDDRGMSLLLTDPFYRDRFAIGKFRPTAPDYQMEADKALALHGLGLRDALYYPWWLRMEVVSWKLNALERIGSNGQFYGFFDEGDPAAETAMAEAIKSLMMFGSVAFPKKPGVDPVNVITAIPPAPVAYEILSEFIGYLDGMMKSTISGSDGQDTPGQGQGADDPRTSDKERTALCDAMAHGDYLTSDVLEPAIRMNDGQLPFKLRVVCQPKIQNVGEITAAMRMFFDMHIPFSRETSYKLTSISPPRDESDAVVAPDPAAMGPPGMDGNGLAEHHADIDRSPTKGIPAMANASVPREGHAASGGLTSHLPKGAKRPDAPRPAAQPLHNARGTDADVLRRKFLAAMIEARRNNRAG